MSTPTSWRESLGFRIPLPSAHPYLKVAGPARKIQSSSKLRQVRKWKAEIPDTPLGLTGIGTRRLDRLERRRRSTCCSSCTLGLHHAAFARFCVSVLYMCGLRVWAIEPLQRQLNNSILPHSLWLAGRGSAGNEGPALLFLSSALVEVWMCYFHS